MPKYTYARIKVDKILELYEEAPKFYNDTGAQIIDADRLRDFDIIPVWYPEKIVYDQNMVYTKEDFAVHNYGLAVTKTYEYFAIENNDIDREKYDVTINPETEWVFENGVVKNYYNIVLKDLDLLITTRRKQIDDIRSEKIFSDLEHTFPTHDGHIQLRDEIDIRNITALGVEVLQDKLSNILDKTYIYCDVENIINSLTADQMLEIVTKVKNHIQDIYNKSWVFKQNIEYIYSSGKDSDKTDEEIIDDVLAYDLTIW